MPSSPNAGSDSLLSIEYEVFPGQSLGPFFLGISLWKVLEYLRENKVSYPHVKVTYDIDNPTVSPVVIRVLPCLDLLFSGYHQRLRSISLRQIRSTNNIGMPALVLLYKNVVLAAPDHILDKARVINTFGPTYPGDIVRYPGVTFSCLDDGGEVEKRQRQKNTDSASLEIQKIVIQQIDELDIDENVDTVMEYPIAFGDVLRVIAEVNKGIKIFLYPSSTAPIDIQFGASAEDLECDLGSPLRKFYKEDNRLDIHVSSASKHHEEDNDFLYGAKPHIKQIEDLTNLFHSTSGKPPPFMELHQIEDERLSSSGPIDFLVNTGLIGFEGIVAEIYNDQILTLTLTSEVI
ncbi:hypothetical protein Clacol_001605 [Clathrus columnatus]|uniref:Uncharacterized protein n=1 Tax=Clathrus columnatus TaxID=1419009 RepID=A0AAV5A2F9_9AGAM|nr:hypothetical protein Clacol_001605 [Clathrus columnatus]